MMFDLAKQLVRVHGARVVHRDLKPGNALWMLQTQTWKLIDFGIACPAGEESPPKCSLAYAPPEVRRSCETEPSHADGRSRLD